MHADRLDPELIENAVGGGFGRPLRYFESIDSTNREALEWAEAGAPEGAVVVTDHQVAGRGRWGRSWSSDPGRLLQLSVILRPELPTSDAGVITTAVGVACARAVAETSGLAARLKWPNDVTVGGRKVAGILVESMVTGSTIDAAIAGIGINVNWRRSDMPEEIQERASSLSEEAGAEQSRLDLLVTVLRELGSARDSMGDDNAREELIVRASELSEVLGHDVTVRFVDGTSTEGRAEQLLPSGALDLVKDGTHIPVHVGEIERLRRI